MRHNCQLPNKAPTRRGVAAFELMFLLPVLLALFTFMVGIADVIIAEQKLDEASARAGRVAAMGGSKEEIEAAVVAVLGSERAKHVTICITPIDKKGEGDSRDGGESQGDQEEAKNYDISTRDNSAGDGYDDFNHRDGAKPDSKCRHLELVEVRIEIDARHATATQLAPLCGSEQLVGRTVVHQHTLTRAECWRIQPE